MTDIAQHLPLPAGLVAVCGDEGTGKTRLLRGLAESLAPRALWIDLSLPGQDDRTPQQVWEVLRAQCPAWNSPLQHALAQALKLEPHLDKQLFMLSTGSRRKVALVALLASGAEVTCLDQPYAALDAASARVVREFLGDMAEHPSRTWVVADYVADAALAWQRVVTLG